MGTGMHTVSVQEWGNLGRQENLTVPISFSMRVGGVECYYWSSDCPRCKDRKTSMTAVPLKKAVWGGKKFTGRCNAE